MLNNSEIYRESDGKLVSEDSGRSTTEHNRKFKNGKFKILVADNDKFVGNLIEKILRNYKGIEVEVVEIGTEAMVRAMTENYSAILIDLHMPNRSGLKAIKTIKSMNPKIPLILMCDQEEVLTESNMQKMGLKRYLRKPFCIGHLINELKNALNIKLEKIATAETTK